LNSPGTKNILSRFSANIVDTLDDGFSGLPAEIKVALGAALLAITPFLGASLAAVVAAALIVGFAGIGTLLAFQFERVRLEGAGLVTFLRNLLTTAASGFVDPVIAGIRTVETRFGKMGPAIGRIFDIAAKFVEPLTDGLVGLVENLLPGVEGSLTNVSGLVDTLSFHMKTLGSTIGDALLIITGSDTLDEGLDDFLTTVETLIITGALLIRVLTDIYGVMKTIVELTTPIGWIGFFTDTAASSHLARTAVGGFQSTLGDTVAPTAAEEKALKEVNDALKAFISNTGNAWQSNINFESSMDDMSEALKKNRGSLNLNTRAGQANQQAILNATLALVKQRDDTITLTGKTEEANATFATNKKRLEDAAVAAGISRAKFRELTGEILLVPPPISPGVKPEATQSVRNATASVSSLNSNMRTAIALARVFGGVVGFVASQSNATGKHITKHADGGVFSSPHVGMVAEAGPEAIIPLNNPARAQQVMNEAGLNGAGGVNVFIGNRQVEAFIDNRVDRRMSMTARTMAYGSRNV
jgi:hypothetical protein